MKKLNQRGFAISAILYTMLVLTVLLMFLVIGILANRRATLNKLSSEAKKRMDGTNNLLYNVVKKSPAAKEGKENGEKVYYYSGNVTDNFVMFNNFCWQMMRTTEEEGIKLIYYSKGSCSNPPLAIINNSMGPNLERAQTQLFNFYQNTRSHSASFDFKDITDSLEEFPKCIDTTIATWVKVDRLSEIDFSCSSSDETYVSLPTVYEISAAGGKKENLNSQLIAFYYLISGYDYVTGSLGDSNQVAYVTSGGPISLASLETSLGIRPVIALKKGTKYASGSGLIDDPYIIE